MPNEINPTEPTSSEDWEACPAGELVRMVRRVETRQRRAHMRQLFTSTAASLVVVALGVLAVGSFFSSNRILYGGICCDVCEENFVAYRAHLTGEQPMADSKLAASMETHLAFCELCRPKFEQTFPGVLGLELRPASPEQVAFFAPRLLFGFQWLVW